MTKIWYIYINDLVIYCKGKNTYNRTFRKNEFLKREINIKKIRIIIKTITKNYKKNCESLYDKMYKCENKTRLDWFIIKFF